MNAGKQLSDKPGRHRLQHAEHKRSMDMGLFRIKETTISHADGHVSISKTPKVTGKGQIYFVNKLMGGNGEVEGRCN